MIPRSLLAGCLGAVALLASSPAAQAASISEVQLDLGSGFELTTQVILGPGQNLTMTDDANFVTYTVNTGTWGIGSDQTCIPDPPGAALAIQCERQTDPTFIDADDGAHAISNQIDTNPFLLTVVQFSTSADSYISANPSPERILAGDGEDSVTGGTGATEIQGGDGADPILDGGAGPDLIVGGPGADTMFLGPGADAVQAQDGVSDTIECTGGGPDTGSFDLSPAETYIGCDGDGDGFVDFFDACPGQTGAMSGCQAALPPLVAQTPTTQPKKCKKGRKLKRGKCVKRKKKRG